MESESDNNSNEDGSTVSETEVISKPNERKGRYRALPRERNERPIPSEPISQICREKNERYSVPGSCDRYIECLGTVLANFLF